MSTQASTSNSSCILSPFLSQITSDMAAQETSFPATQVTPTQSVLLPPSNSANFPELASMGKEFVLNSMPSKSAISLHVCKFTFDRFPVPQQLLPSHGKLRGLVKAFPNLQLVTFAELRPVFNKSFSFICCLDFRIP